MLLATVGSTSTTQHLRLLTGELVVCQDTLLVQLGQPLEPLDRVGASGRGRLGRGRRGRRRGSRSHGLGFLALAPLAGHVGAASHGGGPQQRATSTHQWHDEPPYSAPSGSASPSATMISGAAATTRGPPTWVATARSTPRMSSGDAPSSSAFATCHAYEAGGASIAISAAILTSANVRPSSPDTSSSASRRPTARSSICMSPPEIPDSASCVSGAT